MSSQQLKNFLKKENKGLKQQNSQLKTLLQLNRQALKLSIQFKKGQVNFPVLVNMLYQENSKLHRRINQLKNQLQTGLCKALISQQIAFASTQQQKYLTTQLKDKLSKMRKQLQFREKKIVELTKTESEKKGNNLQCKVVQISDLSLTTKKFKDEIFELRNQLQQKNQQVMKYKDQKQELIKLNLLLTKQINEYKVLVSHPSTGGSNQDLSKFLKIQNKLIQGGEDDNESNEDQFDQSNSDDQSSPQQSIQQEVVQQTKVPKISKMLEISKNNIPKLKLEKAKQIQDLIVQKINNQQSKKKGVVKQQKFKKLQVQVANLRKKIGKIMVQKMQIEKQNEFLKKFVKQLQNRNLLLCQTKKKDETNKMQQQNNRMQQQNETQTLIDICKDVTLNLVLRKVVNGTLQLPYSSNVKSYDI